MFWLVGYLAQTEVLKLNFLAMAFKLIKSWDNRKFGTLNGPAPSDKAGI